MTKNIKYLTRNAKLVCAADFFWNLGRTFPHAILTIFLLEQGFDLVQIATLQSVFMIVAMVTGSCVPAYYYRGIYGCLSFLSRHRA